MRSRLAVGEPIDDGHLEQLVARQRFGQYIEDRAIPVEGARRLLQHELSNRPIDEDHGFVTATSSDGADLGLLTFRLSAWDSEHFGFPVGIVDHLLTSQARWEREREIVARLLDQFELWCEGSRIRFAFAKIPALDLPAVHAFENSGFRYIETWLYNRLDLGRAERPAAAPTVLIRRAEEREMDTMLRWSESAFSTQRFHADPNVRRETADALYRKWIQTAFSDSRRQVMAAEIDGEVAGFFDFEPKDLSAWIGIHAIRWRMFIVDPSRRGDGLGTRLLAAFIWKQKMAGFDRLESGLSLRNVHSSNLHARAGFENIAFLVTLHKWWDGNR